MKKLFALLMLFGVVAVGCQGTETTTTEPATPAAEEAAETATDEHAGHDHAEGESHDEEMTDEVTE